MDFRIIVLSHKTQGNTLPAPKKSSSTIITDVQLLIPLWIGCSSHESGPQKHFAGMGLSWLYLGCSITFLSSLKRSLLFRFSGCRHKLDTKLYCYYYILRYRSLIKLRDLKHQHPPLWDFSLSKYSKPFLLVLKEVVEYVYILFSLYIHHHAGCGLHPR